MSLQTEPELTQVMPGVWHSPPIPGIGNPWGAEHLEKLNAEEYSRDSKVESLNGERRVFLMSHCCVIDGKFERNYIKTLCDFGAGNGGFLRRMPLDRKYTAVEICCAARQQLERDKKRSGLKLRVYTNMPRRREFQVVTAWNSLQCCKTPNDARAVIGRAGEFLAVSTPIIPYRALEDTGYKLKPGMRQWKHFDESRNHLYWTRDGFISFVESEGFELVAYSRLEEWNGAQDIGTFGFRRIGG